MRKLILPLIVALAAPAVAQAQVAAQNPPVRKYKGFCFVPERGEYRKLPEFVPFRGLDDCLKSGGLLPPPPANAPGVNADGSIRVGPQKTQPKE